GMGWIRHPGIAHVVNDSRFEEDEKLLDTSFPGFFRMDEMMVPFPSSLVLHRDKQPEDVELKVTARTTPGTTSTTDGPVDMSLREQWETRPPFEQRIIGAVAEGKLKSAFAGKPDESIKPADRAPEPSRVFVLASSQFLTKPLAYAGNGPELGGQFQMMGGIGGDQQLQMMAGPYAQKYLTATILSLKNTLDWMSGDTDLIAASAKILGEPNLTYSSIRKPEFKAEDSEEEMRRKDEEYRKKRKELQQQGQWSLTLGVPVLFAGFGVVRWRSRESKRYCKVVRGRFAMAMTADKKLYLSLAVLAVLGGALYYQNQSAAADRKAHSYEGMTNLPSLSITEEDTKALTRIVIEQPAKEAKDGEEAKATKHVLVKEGDEWRLEEPLKARGNQANVESLLKNLAGMKVKERLSSGADAQAAFAQYDLTDDKAVHAAFFAGDEKKYEFWFGKGGGRGQTARWDGADGVFVVDGYSSFLYTRDTKGWRDLSIFKFEQDDVVAVTIENEHGSYQFDKDGDEWSAKFKKAKAPVAAKLKDFEQSKIDDMLRAYKSLNASGFGDDKK